MKPPLRSVLLYGELGRLFGKQHRFVARNAAEAIRALRANFKGFEKFMYEAHLKSLRFQVVVGDSSIDEVDEIRNPSSARETLRIIPVLQGSSGEFKVFLGAVLLVAAGVLAVGSFGTSSGFSLYLGTIGAGLLIGGVAQLLAPAPPTARQRGEPDEGRSYVFNGAENTSIQGRAVPIVYGRMMVGSAVISAGIETEDA